MEKAGVKKPYRQPTVTSQKLQLGVYGQYSDESAPEGPESSGGKVGRGDHRGFNSI